MEVEYTTNIEELRAHYAKDFSLAARQMAAQMLSQIAHCSHPAGGNLCAECRRAATILKTVSVCFSVMADAFKTDKIDEFRLALCEFGRMHIENFPFESACDGTANSGEQFPEIIYDKGEQ